MLMLMHQKDNNTNQKVTSQWLHPCLIGCSTFALMLWAVQQTTWLHHFQITQFLFWLCSAIKMATYQKTHTLTSLFIRYTCSSVAGTADLLESFHTSFSKVCTKRPKTEKTSSDHLWMKIPGWYRTRAGQLKAIKKATITQINALVLM